MDAREHRGLVIAAFCKLRRTPKGWLVPSQTTTDRIYRVDAETQTCSCPDHQEGGFKCKHLFAVEITIKRECNPDGTMIETRSVTLTEKRVYRQNWIAYNDAQTHEKERFQVLLYDLCRGIPEPARTPSQLGRKPHLVSDMIFAAAFKVYTTFSTRRFATDLREAFERGYLSKPVPGTKVAAFHENPNLTPLLRGMIACSARPLRAVETEFAIDSTGFSTCKFERWYDQKYGVTRRRCVWVKVHAAVGVKTNAITAVRVLDKDSADCPQFKPLVEETARGFVVSEVSADKAYGSLENFETVADCGGSAFIAFKDNATGGVGGLYQKMFHYFQYRKEDFLAHYHKRSNVESTFSAVKRKFGDSCRSRTDVAMVNEVLCKLLCHNLCCLIQEQANLGIEPVFWQDKEAGISLQRNGDGCNEILSGEPIP